MAQITFKETPIHTEGNLPEVNAPAPDFKAVSTDLSEKSLSDYKGKTVILNIFPSVDTGVCAASVRRFHEKSESVENLVVLNISQDLPFAHKRFCGAEGIENAIGLSDFRYHEVAQKYGVTMKEGPLAGLLSRAVVVVDANGKVTYTQQVSEVTHEPDYDKALAAAQA